MSHYDDERDSLLATVVFRVKAPPSPVVDISRVWLRIRDHYRLPPVDVYLIISSLFHRVWFLPGGADRMEMAGPDGVEWRWR